MSVASRILILLLCSSFAGAEDLMVTLAGRPVGTVRVLGGTESDTRFALNNLRSLAGSPLDAAIVRADIRRLTELGRFSEVVAKVTERPDGAVDLVYRVVLAPIIRSVEVQGNRRLGSEQILNRVPRLLGSIRDEALLERAARDVELWMRGEGYLESRVEFTSGDRPENLILLVSEGPRAKVRSVRFRGNASMEGDRLQQLVEVKPAILLLESGTLDESKLDEDAKAVRDFYRGRGWRDARVDWSVTRSPDDREAIVTFYVLEGVRYQLGDVRIEIAEGEKAVMDAAQINALLGLQLGSPWEQASIDAAIVRVESGYHALGYLDVRIVDRPVRPGPGANIDLQLKISEGPLSTVGQINIRGNVVTRDKVIRRELDLRPGRPFDKTGIQEAERRLDNLRHFSEVRVQIGPAKPDQPGVRDLLVFVRERNTGVISFGGAVGSDSGIYGEFRYSQSNFDATRPPESWGIDGLREGFRGGGQNFQLTIQPGTELFRYSLNFEEPRVFDTEWGFRTNLTWQERQYIRQIESSRRATVGVDRRFGNNWNASFNLRSDAAEIDPSNDSVPVEYFLDGERSTVNGVGLQLRRTTLSSFFRPTAGGSVELSLEQVGFLGGDFSWWKADLEWTQFFLLGTDDQGRNRVLRWNARLGNIFDSVPRVPLWERYYLGGNSLRGFENRTISPKSVRASDGEPSSDPIGGSFLAFAGLQYEHPLVGENFALAVFVDSGTVLTEPGVESWRVAAGIGGRFYLPFLGPVPMAIDLAWPLVQEDLDQTQVLSFRAELPF